MKWYRVVIPNCQRARSTDVMAPGARPSARTRPRGGTLPAAPGVRTGCRVETAVTSCLGGELDPRDRARARRSAVPAAGAPDAGPLLRGAHPARLLRDRVSGDGRLPRVVVPAHRRPALPPDRAALVEADARALRRGRRHGHDPLLRDGAALAELHG